MSKPGKLVLHSDRRLERKFRQQAGVSFKALARKVRFEKVRDHLSRHPQAPLAALAQGYGYADQAHLAVISNNSVTKRQSPTNRLRPAYAG